MSNQNDSNTGRKRMHTGNAEISLNFSTGVPVICTEGFTYKITGVRLITTEDHIITDIQREDCRLTDALLEFETFRFFGNKVEFFTQPSQPLSILGHPDIKTAELWFNSSMPCC